MDEVVGVCYQQGIKGKGWRKFVGAPWHQEAQGKAYREGGSGRSGGGEEDKENA